MFFVRALVAVALAPFFVLPVFARPVVSTPQPPTAPPVIPAAPPQRAAPSVLPSRITVAPPPPTTSKPSSLPFPTLPAVTLDPNDTTGIAQQIARDRGVQGRVLWIDGTANIERVNSADKIAALCARIKQVGFNTIVFDVKPIIGYTLYPSKYAPKLTEWVRPWGTRFLARDFDPLREMVAQAHAQGLGLIVNLNAFSEGHRDFGRGPGYDNPQWQTVLYEPQTRVRRDVLGTPSWPVMDKVNTPGRGADDLMVYNDLSRVRADNSTFVALLDSGGNVLAQVSGAAIKTIDAVLPKGGAALVASTSASVGWLRVNALPGYRLTLDTAPQYVPISQRPERQVPLMTNPNNPEVTQRLLNMLAELATNYAIDGVIFDDRLRYAAPNADFSPATRTQFEQYIGGKKLRWPDDVFRYDYDFPEMDRHVVPGPYYAAWQTFRALTLRNWLADAVRTVKGIRPQATISTYVGSWYPDYPDVGANWGADDLQAGFHFLNDSYRKTGWAGLTDFVTTGCYYNTATIAEAAEKGGAIGETVEAAGQFSNRAVNDQTFVYAGISLDQFKGRPDALRRVLQAACATTQGVMCFDLSHDIDALWFVFEEAFAKPAVAPHQVPGLIGELRGQRATQKASGVVQPPVILYRGAAGTGF